MQPIIRYAFRFVLLTGCLFTIFGIRSHADIPETVLMQPDRPHSTPWVDSVLASLSLEQRIAQLMMVSLQTDREASHYKELIHKIEKYNIGGGAFFRGSPTAQLMLTNRLQSRAQTPLLVAMDAEWGPSMRLDSTPVFPNKMTLGAINDDQLIYQMGLEVGRQLQRLGVHMNFAPVVDVNNNPRNPVINFRAFGEDRENVTRKGLAYMHGMQDTGILACAKHFPGHGDTDADSHHSLPLMHHLIGEMDSIHLYPFRQMINQGLKAVMVAHLEIPAFEPEARLASTLSQNIVTGLLKYELGFNGLVITDGLYMRGAGEFFEPGEIELRALMAGNDILLQPRDIEAAIVRIAGAVKKGLISEETIDVKCRKVLYFKQKAGLDNFSYLSPESLISDLSSQEATELNKSLAAASLTLLRNSHKLIPISGLGGRRLASVAIGAEKDNTFQALLSRYSPVKRLIIDKEYSADSAAHLMEQLVGQDVVIVSVHNNSQFATRDYGLPSPVIDLIRKLGEKHRVILCLFANPYSLELFGDNLPWAESILLAYQGGAHFEKAAAHALFGGIEINGRLPVSASPYFAAMEGIEGPPPSRIRFGSPEEAGIRSDLLDRIDSLAMKGIRIQAYPGCQIAVIKDGVMIYNKSFGYHTYDRQTPVSQTDVYDLASLTKIAATTLSVMRLADMGLLDINKRLGDYLPWLGKTNKGSIVLKDLLAHQAGLIPYIPFHLKAGPPGEEGSPFALQGPDDEFRIEVASSLFVRESYRDSIMSGIAESPLLQANTYRYSDLGFILLAGVIESVSGQNIHEFSRDVLFRPLGLPTMGYLPLERLPAHRIPPSEHDSLWRKQRVQGFVNDQTAALLGGISGHAGLFSNAAEMAVLMQLLLNEGHYGGERYFSEATVREFTRAAFDHKGNRRGLGFDKPALNREGPGPSCWSASPMSFGHSGFTGTYAWADPVENLVYVFLSNRTWPDPGNRRLAEENIRTDIHQVIYDAIHHSKTLRHFTTSSTLEP